MNLGEGLLGGGQNSSHNKENMSSDSLGLGHMFHCEGAGLRMGRGNFQVEIRMLSPNYRTDAGW